jgi:tetratricopeptide (TPR) repeat protein
MRTAAQFFEEAGFPYGRAASYTILARAYYAASSPAEASQAASRASTLANTHGYLRIMAESSFWTGELMLAKDPTREVEHYFKTAGELFEAVGSSTWSALAAASEILAGVEGGTTAIDENEAKALLGQFRDVWKRFAVAHGDTDTFSRSWATAVLARRLGALARRAGESDTAAESFQHSVDSYLAQSDLLGATMARAGLAATRNNHKEVQRGDVQEAINDPVIAAGAQPIDEAAKAVIRNIEDDFGAEMSAAV